MSPPLERTLRGPIWDNQKACSRRNLVKEWFMCETSSSCQVTYNIIMVSDSRVVCRNHAYIRRSSWEFTNTCTSCNVIDQTRAKNDVKSLWKKWMFWVHQKIPWHLVWMSVAIKNFFKPSWWTWLVPWWVWWFWPISWSWGWNKGIFECPSLFTRQQLWDWRNHWWPPPLDDFESSLRLRGGRSR